ncbi:hypothetical protein NNJEOMEG_03851 [Fundidesulfovibrio magnetotacticus]|uniref:Uncharacterized protein n=1 Tax=Fundidesulfovibrio magnetotacticus TaxID=2730080 RepID=A0A6V8M2D3_9BACT|nr:hypothetical protein [Fundidesulfovibrio magnetotacticus]GFK95977.1 hypothetical protein NNJEOMEG_03851 [Fundidesulfovibrio magnetotacticus]
MLQMEFMANVKKPYTKMSCIPPSEPMAPTSLTGRRDGRDEGPLKAAALRHEVRRRPARHGRSPSASPGIIPDADPALITQALDNAFKARFRDVVALESFEDRTSAGGVAVMFLDIQVLYGQFSSQMTTVSSLGIVVDDGRQPVEQIRGDGSAMRPPGPNPDPTTCCPVEFGRCPAVDGQNWMRLDYR